MSLQFDKTDPVHTALREGLGLLVKRYFAAILAAEARTVPSPVPTAKGKRIVTAHTRKPMSQAMRKHLSLVQKARWAKWHKAQGSTPNKRT